MVQVHVVVICAHLSWKKNIGPGENPRVPTGDQLTPSHTPRRGSNPGRGADKRLNRSEPLRYTYTRLTNVYGTLFHTQLTNKYNKLTAFTKRTCWYYVDDGRQKQLLST